MIYANRYNRNKKVISEEDQQVLKSSSILVVGCGGLGGYIIELLGRLGIGKITAVDGDVFDESNLNRQLLSSEDVIGKSKAKEAEARMSKVNSEVKVKGIQAFLTEDNYQDVIKGHDLVIDALDNGSARRLLEKGCREFGITMIHGAIAGWYAQVAVVPPESQLMEKLYPHGEEKGIETELGNPSFTPALTASLQVAEAVKILLQKGEPLKEKLLTIDLLEQEYDVFQV